MPSPGPDGVDTGIYTARAASTLLEIYTAAFLHPQSRFHGDRQLVERMKLAAGYLQRAQHEDGLIDYLDTNFDSTPDTAFTVWSAATAACLAQRANNRELAAITGPFLQNAARGLAKGGVHTPNHRWVVSSALAQINEVFPNPDYLRRIDQWLAEGIDMDADGQYTERSTAVYNPICDRCFVVLAAKLKRDDLLLPVRKNLQSMLYLLHSNGEVVTEISRRQDRSTRAGMKAYWFPLQYLAVKDADGHYATLASQNADAASLSVLMEYPEMAAPLPPPVALPDQFVKEMNSLGVVRFRRGKQSSTLISADPAFFTSYCGEAAVEAVRMASAFFGKGQFWASAIEKTSQGFRLEQKLEAGYYQPLEPTEQVAAGEWGRLRDKRNETEICTLEQSIMVREISGGFRLSISVRGTKNVPVAVEINFRDGGTLNGCERAGEDTHLLAKGFGTYSTGGASLRFGPGLCQHRCTKIRGALPKLPGHSVYLTAFSPFSHELELTWS